MQRPREFEASGTALEKAKGKRWEVRPLRQGGRDRSSRALWAMVTASVFALRWEPPRSLSRAT